MKTFLWKLRFFTFTVPTTVDSDSLMMTFSSDTLLLSSLRLFQSNFFSLVKCLDNIECLNLTWIQDSLKRVVGNRLSIVLVARDLSFPEWREQGTVATKLVAELTPPTLFSRVRVQGLCRQQKPLVSSIWWFSLHRRCLRCCHLWFRVPVWWWGMIVSVWGWLLACTE